MREEEKIFAGKLFDARTQELRDIKHKAHSLCMKFNSMDEYDPERLPLIRQFIGAIGEKYYFQGPIQFNYGSHTFIGENFFANFNLTVMDDGKIFIGNDVMMGPNVSLLCTNHPLIAQERARMRYPDGHVSMSEFAGEIHIEDHRQGGGHRRRQCGDPGHPGRVAGGRCAGQAHPGNQQQGLQAGPAGPLNGRKAKESRGENQKIFTPALLLAGKDHGSRS